MKLSHLKSLCVAGALAAVVSTPAHAWSWSGCGVGKFLTCASVNVVINGSEIWLTVDNYGSFNPSTLTEQVGAGASVFQTLGLSGAGFTLTGLSSFSCLGGTAGADATCDWGFDSNLTNLSNLGGAPFAGGQATPPPSSNGLDPGSGGTYYRVLLKFSTTGSPNIDNSVFGLHGISGPNGCSTKFQVTSGGVVSSSDAADPLCVETVVPEPMTMSLVALGLVMMGGAGLVRRRRKV